MDPHTKLQLDYNTLKSTVTLQGQAINQLQTIIVQLQQVNAQLTAKVAKLEQQQQQQQQVTPAPLSSVSHHPPPLVTPTQRTASQQLPPPPPPLPSPSNSGVGGMNNNSSLPPPIITPMAFSQLQQAHAELQKRVDEHSRLLSSLSPSSTSSTGPTGIIPPGPSRRPSVLSTLHPPTEAEVSQVLQAARSGNVALMETLLNTHGIDLSRAATTKERITALHEASGAGYVDVCKFLVGTAGSPVDVPDCEGATALHFAVRNGKLDVCKYLVSVGADARVTDRNGLTMLHWAADKGHPSVCQFLVSLGAKVNCATKVGGTTPLHCAAFNTDAETCRYLVSVGADPDLMNNAGRTALQIALSNNRTRTADYLRTVTK